MGLGHRAATPLHGWSWVVVASEPRAAPLPALPHPQQRTFPWVLDLVCVKELHEHFERPGLSLADGHTQQGRPGPPYGPTRDLPGSRGCLLLRFLQGEEGELRGAPWMPLPWPEGAGQHLTWASRSRACTIFLRSQRLRAVTMATWPCTHSSFCSKNDILVGSTAHSSWQARHASVHSPHPAAWRAGGAQGGHPPRPAQTPRRKTGGSPTDARSPHAACTWGNRRTARGDPSVATGSHHWPRPCRPPGHASPAQLSPTPTTGPSLLPGFHCLHCEPPMPPHPPHPARRFLRLPLA